LRAFQSQLGSIKSMACRNIIMGTHWNLIMKLTIAITILN
jgi:hypothetical protein